jgi:hypothetical protein
MKFRALFKSKPADTPAPASAEPQVSGVARAGRPATTGRDSGVDAAGASPARRWAASVYQAVLALDPQNWASSNALASIALQVGETAAPGHVNEHLVV